MGIKFKYFWYFVNRNIKTLMFAAILLTSLLVGFAWIYNSNKNINEPKIYSLIEGTINGQKTYFLMSMDSISIDTKPPLIVLDSSTCINNSKVSLNGLEISYDKRYDNLSPLINEIKEPSGYEISGVIGNDLTPIDTLRK